MSDIEGDSHLAQIAEANAAALPDRADDHTGDGVHATANAPQIVQVNTLSTPVVIVILAVLTLVGMIAAASAVFAYISERSVALAKYEIEFAIKQSGLPAPLEKPK